MEEKRAIHKIALYVDLGKAILFLENIKSGKLDLTKVGDQKLKAIMLNYTPDVIFYNILENLNSRFQRFLYQLRIIEKGL